MKLTNDKDLKGKHVEATVRLWLWHVEGMIKLSTMLVNVLYFISGLEVLNYKLPTLQNKDELQNSSLAASSIKVLTSGPANISHDMKGLVDMSEGSPVPTILGYSNLDSLVSLGITSKDLYTQTKLEIASRIPIIQFLVGGATHTMMLTKNFKGQGNLYACGWNEYGQLGLGDNEHRNKWTEVPVPPGFSVEKVIAGGVHTFLKGKGKNGEDKLYACGRNWDGQLGLSDGRNRTEFTEVTMPEGFKLEQVMVGGAYSFLKGKDVGGQDKLYASGYNEYGQLGLGDTKDRNEWTEVAVPQGFSVEKELAGNGYSYLKGKGKDGEDKLYASGWNNFGQLGLGDNEHRNKWTEVPVPPGFSVEKVIAGGVHTFLKGKGKDGEDMLYACGSNASGQLGLGHRGYRNIWTEVPLPQGFSVEKVVVGDNHSFLKGTVDGEDKLYASGWNKYGQLGLGDNENRRDWTGVFLDKNDWLKRILRDERNRETQSKIDVINNKRADGLGL